MKKILTLLLVLSMTLALGACAQVEKLKNVELPPLPQVTLAKPMLLNPLMHSRLRNLLNS